MFHIVLSFKPETFCICNPPIWEWWHSNLRTVIWLLEVATSLSSVLGVVSLILVSGSQVKQVSNGRGPLSLCFYSVAKGGPYCFLTQVLHQLSFYFLPKPDEVEAVSLPLVPGNTSLVCGLARHHRFHSFHLQLDFPENWFSPMKPVSFSSSVHRAFFTQRLNRSFGLLHIGLKMKAPRSVILFPAQGSPKKKSAVSKWFL